MQLKIHQIPRCLIAFQNRPSVPIGRDENFVISISSKDNFVKKSLPSIILNFLFPAVSFSGVFLTLKCGTLVL